MDQDKIMDGLSKEIEFTLKAMSKTKNLDEKEAYSRILKNLCEAQGVFLNFASELMSLGMDEDADEEKIPF